MEDMLGEDNIIRGCDLQFEPNPGGLGVELFQKMKKNKYYTAQICALTGHRDTYGSLLQRSIRTAIEMQNRGVTREDVIALCTYNQLNSAVPYVATFLVGAKVAALDPTISFEDTKHLINQVCPKLVFVVPECKDMYEDVISELALKTQIIVFNDASDYDSISFFLKPKEAENDFRPVIASSIHDTAIIFFSSGTTGLAKGICINHYTIMGQAVNISVSGLISNVVCSFATFYWISSAMIFVQTVMKGHTRLICKSFTPKDAWELIEKYKVTQMFVAPSQAMAMMKHGKPEGLNTATLYDLMVGGGPMSSENMMAFKDLFPGTNVGLVYGQTEVAGLITIFKPAVRKDIILMHSKPSSSGRPSFGMWFKVIDLETEEVLGPNRRGELRVKTKMQLNGYYNIPSDGIWDEDGWLKTGDVCYYDEDLCFYIVDRIKEMMKYQSWHIPPALLEGVLQQHPAVRTAVVFGVPHDEDGEHPMAVVVLMPDCQDVREEELVEFVNCRVDNRQKIRAGIRFMDSIPLTPSGKVKRKALKDFVLEEMKYRI
ncbi:luciferin 4-monooxygenase-like [Onthophagus taurus]|uniref:luciferin 4-monooxygenase-like n=1 Tax=Onthophagus taurus TaxID=166361 RepID=UPI0039BE5372